MSNFIKLGPCPHCGSRDNRAEYKNGYWCFGCSTLELKKDTQTLRDRVYGTQQTKADSNLSINVIKQIPQKAMQWLLKYDIRQDEIDKYNIGWEPDMNILVLLQNSSYWQGRNFGFGNMKYKSNGMKPLTIYGEGDTIIVVEDVLSAIKIARTHKYCASPLLGSSLSKQAESQLVKDYKKIYVWLDRDKAKQAVRIRNRLRSLGVSSKAIITELDPKEYDKQTITEIVND
jgi:hypothetical protein